MTRSNKLTIRELRYVNILYSLQKLKVFLAYLPLSSYFVNRRELTKKLLAPINRP
jgi:hypothetical protein